MKVQHSSSKTVYILDYPTRKNRTLGKFHGKKVSVAPEHFSLEPAKLKESIRKIAILNFDVMLPGHGETLKPNASEQTKKFAESLTQE